MYHVVSLCLFFVNNDDDDDDDDDDDNNNNNSTSCLSEQFHVLTKCSQFAKGIY